MIDVFSLKHSPFLVVFTRRQEKNLNIRVPAAATIESANTEQKTFPLEKEKK